MASWAALNAAAPRASADEARDVATEEALEARNAALYESALRLQQQQKTDDARAIYAELLNETAGLSARLRYLCAKNLATLEAERRAFDGALRYFSEALRLDATDVLVWYQMGKAAVETGELWLARRAFETGFQVDATFWPLVRELCDVLQAVGDAAAYQQVAAYLLQHDPHAGGPAGPIRAFDMNVEAEFRALPAKGVVTTHPPKRLSRASEGSQKAAKRLKHAHEEAARKASEEKNRAPLTYVLQQGSWLSLGKLLLEAYEDATSEESSGNPTRRVLVSVDFPAVAVEDPKPIAIEDQASQEAVVDLTEEDGDSRGKGSAEEPIALDLDAGDGDGDGDGDAHGDKDALEVHRRKSRRHADKLREEHEIAAKLAREKDLAYRLKAFIPSPTHIPARQTLSDFVFSVAEGVVSLRDTTNREAVHVFHDVLPEIDNTDRPSGPVGTSRPAASSTTSRLGREHIESFVQNLSSDSCGVEVISFLRGFLNYCGDMADQDLRGEGDYETDYVHPVCLWAERVVRGRLHSTCRVTDDAEPACAPARVGIYRTTRDGLTTAARVFLLELRLDDLLHNNQHQRRASKRLRTKLDEVVNAAEGLLFELCWDADEQRAGYDESGSDRGSKLQARLFWMCARVCERLGNPSAAKHHYRNCLEVLGGLRSNTIALLNLRERVCISAGTVQEKLGSLQYADVCSDASTMVQKGLFDEALVKLLGYFFTATGDDSRVIELLDDFGSSTAEGQTEEDIGDQQERSMLLVFLDSLARATRPSLSKKCLLSLVLVHRLTERLLSDLKVLRTRRKAAGTEQGSIGDKLVVTTRAISVALDRLLAIVTSDREGSTDTSCARAVVAVVGRLIDYQVLLLYESPRDFLLTAAKLVEALSTHDKILLGVFVKNVFTSYRHLKKLSPTDVESASNITGMGAGKSKKKPGASQDRVRQFFEAALSLMATYADQIVFVVPTVDLLQHMEESSAMLKEEEEHLTRKHLGEKLTRKIFCIGAILLLRLFTSLGSLREDKDVASKDLPQLVELLHERLGKHELCHEKCLNSVSPSKENGPSPSSKSFVQVASALLRQCQDDSHEPNGAARVAGEAVKKENSRDDESDTSMAEDTSVDDHVEDDFDIALAQCFRCMYDVHILPGRADHKTGSSPVDLDKATAEEVHELAKFAIPMMLKRPPKSNAQKKENLKVLLALRRALSADSDILAQLPVQPNDTMLRYLNPHTLLDWSGDAPHTELAIDDSVHEQSSLDHLWFLLGENFILLRVRRRSNLNELIEMEKRIKERVGYLVKDVQHFRPRRIKSWIRLGRAMKELYHIASDACVLVLGRRRKLRALEAYAQRADATAEPIPCFEDMVLKVSLFEQMKTWHEVEDRDAKDQVRVAVECSRGYESSELAQPTPRTVSFCLEEFFIAFILQVIEFSRRCFQMGASLAKQLIANPVDGMDEETLDETAKMAIDCDEESGLLMYNLLQECADARHDTARPAPSALLGSFYLKMLDSAHRYLENGLSSALSMKDTFDATFRLHYMIGKVMKKRRWFDMCRLHQEKALTSPSKPTACMAYSADSSRRIMECLARAEQAHEDGKMDKSIVHAFYQLQAMRLELVLVQPAETGRLSLACDHYFEEAVDDGEDEDDNDDDAESGADKTKNDGNETSADEAKVGKEDVKTLLQLGSESGNEKYTQLAQAWLFLNVIEALESISDEDRYFHPSRHALAKAMYHYEDIVSRLSCVGDVPDAPPAASASACILALGELKKKKKNDGVTAAEIALKEMSPLFDKRRPQVVAIWLSEHIPVAKRFEELNQRQMKFDCCRLKYWRHYVSLLQESRNYARLKEIGSWVLSCKEEHDVIDEMLGVVLHARGVVQLARLCEYVSVDLVEQAHRYQQERTERAEKMELGAESTVDLTREAADDPADLLMKELGKAYVNYLDVADSRPRLMEVMPPERHDELTFLAEFPVVCLFSIGVVEYPHKFELLDQDELSIRRHIVEMNPAVRAVLLDESDRVPASVRSGLHWEPLVHAARLLCEEQWPDRHATKSGGAKHARKPRQPKAAAAASAPLAASAPAHAHSALSSGDAQPPAEI